MQTDETLISYSVVGSNGTVPDAFMLTGTGGAYKDMDSFIQHCNRNDGETDQDFWDRMMRGVSALVTPLAGHPRTKQAVIITCMYEQSDFDPPPSFPKDVFKKGKRK